MLFIDFFCKAVMALCKALCMIGEGHVDIRKAPLRNINIHREDALMDTPLHLYQTPCTHRRALAPDDVAYGMRLDLYQISRTSDAQEVGYQEILDMSHHKVVHRGTHIRIPLFGQRGVPLLDLIAIAWHVVVVQYGVEKFPLVVFY